MKKNAMLKIAAILMVAVLLTTCAISSTFAKYVTTGAATGNEVGRVAKWDVEIVSNVDGLFADKYENGAVNASGDDVVSVSTDNVVAPGTANSASLTATLNGQPEVAFRLTTVATVSLSGWMVDLDGTGEGEAIYYCPLVVKVNGTAVEAGANAAAFAANIKSAIETAATKDFAAGTELDDEVVGVTVEWAWDFDANGAGTNDAKDTILGEAGSSTISIAIQQTATQIKNYTAPAQG